MMKDSTINAELAIGNSTEKLEYHDKTLQPFQITPLDDGPFPPRAEMIQRSSFDPVPSSNTADIKYAPDGRFGFDPLELSSNMKNKKPTLNHERQVPRTDALRKEPFEDDSSDAGGSRDILFGLSESIH